MTINLDGTNTILGILAGMFGIFAIGFSVLRYVIRAETSELRNNGGSTMKDAVDRIDAAAKVAAEKAHEAAHMATQTKTALDRHVSQSEELLEQGRKSEREIRGLLRHGQEADDEIRGTIATLADAVKIAAQSTPPEEHP